MTQTSYASRLIAKKLGNFVTAFDATHEPVNTGEVETATITPGKGVIQGTADGQAKIPTATGGTFLGVVVANHDRARDGIAGSPVPYAIGEELAYLSRGRIYVYAETAVNKGDAAFLRHTDNATLVAGDFRLDADTARADAVNAVFDETITAAGIVALKLLPQ